MPFYLPILSAQEIERFNSFSYNVNEGLLQSHADDLAFDENNFGWLSFANGIQKFDGNSFENVPVQPGLPDDKSVHFFTTSKGELLVSHALGISKYDVSNNRFIQVWNSDAAYKLPAIFLAEDDAIVYFFTAEGNIEGIDVETFSRKSFAKTNFKKYSYNLGLNIIRSSNVFQHKIGLYIDSTLFLWDLKAHKALSYPNPINICVFFKFWISGENEMWFMTLQKDSRLICHNFISGKDSLVAILPVNLTKPFRGSIFSWKKRKFIHYFNNIYEINNSLNNLKKTIVNFQNQPMSGNYAIDNVREDNLGNLYLLTTNNGIRKIIQNNFPIKYYGAGYGKSSFCVAVYADKPANRVLCSTYTDGLMIFDTLQRLIKQIQYLPEGKGVFNPASIVKAADGSYLLFCWGKTDVWNLSSNLEKLSILPVSNPYNSQRNAVNYYSNILLEKDNFAWVHSSGSVYKIDRVTKSINYYLISARNHYGGMLYKNTFVIHESDYLAFIDTATMQVVRKITLKNTGGVRCFASNATNNIYVGTNKGVFVIGGEGKLLYQINKEKGLLDECIYAMKFDTDGDLWCSTNRGLVRISGDRVILQLNKEDGLQENEFNSNAAMVASDGELYFGGVNGVSSFYPADITSKKDKLNLLVTKIKINHDEIFKDTAVWNIQKIDLPYYQNSLSFDFIAMGNANPRQYAYQYKMEGIDDRWVQNNDLQTVRYLLPPGNYTFKIYASRFFDKDAKPLKEINIKIHPPFWKTWWFVSLAVLGMLIIIIYVVNQYNKRKYTRKLMELEAERKMQVERERISRDLHDNIGAYANAVLYKTDLLQNEGNIDERNELMNDLKFASKDIITSLRETIWALKKEKYTAQECMMRISNFITPLNRFYKDIHIAIVGQAPAEKDMHYIKALNLVRIVQEAVSNAIKHANATNILITSTVKNTGWEVAITDNGLGFDEGDLSRTGEGNGLSNMRQRSTEAGFVFDIHSSAAGTTISVLVCR